MVVKVIDNYKKFEQEYLEIFQPLFEAAIEFSEFNFVMSLLAFRGMSDTGWEPYENTVVVAKQVHKEQDNFSPILRLNMNLWMYVNLIECSEHFELIANMLRTVKGEDYIIANHKDRNFVNLKITNKIARLAKIAKGTRLENVVFPFKESYNSRFRNAIGHGDYALKSGDRGGVTVSDDAGFPVIFSHQETSDLVNRSLALHAVIMGIREHYIKSYQQSKVIKSSPGFGHGSPIDITLIARKDKGLLGFRCIGGYDLGKPFETRILRCTAGELKLVEEGINNLPAKIAGE
jgi:hypothetical protein